MTTDTLISLILATALLAAEFGERLSKIIEKDATINPCGQCYSSTLDFSAYHRTATVYS